MELLMEGLTITGIGIGFVMTFLCLLIVVMVIMAKILQLIGKIFPEPVEESAQPKKIAAGDDVMVAIAIAAAKRGL